VSGINIRMKRFFRESSGKTVIFPLDHGVTCGPILGIENLATTMRWGVEAGADAFVLHKGMFDIAATVPGLKQGLFLHVSGSTQLGRAVNRKVPVSSVEEAIRRGADGVSCHINLANPDEPEMIRDLGILSDACFKWQMPLLVMIYIRGSYANEVDRDQATVHAVRLAAELGATIIKTSCPSSQKYMEKLVQVSHVPVVLAGGAKVSNEKELLNRIHEAMKCGIHGVAVGRNVFQHSNPVLFLKAILGIVHEEMSPQEAWDMLVSAGE